MSKFLRKLSPVLFLCLLLPLGACKKNQEPSTGESNSVMLEPLYQHTQCGAEQVKATLIDTPEELSAWWQTQARMTLPAPELPAPFRQLDWNEDNIIVIYAGSRPSAGYELKLEENTARIEERTLIVDVRLDEPPPDAMVAQVITSPCIAVAAAKGHYKAVKVINSEGGVFTSAQ